VVAQNAVRKTLVPARGRKHRAAKMPTVSRNKSERP